MEALQEKYIRLILKVPVFTKGRDWTTIWRNKLDLFMAVIRMKDGLAKFLRSR